MGPHDLVALAEAAQAPLEYVDDERPEVRGPWTPKDIADVDWALRRLAEAEDDAAQIHAQAGTAIAAVRAREAELVARVSAGGAYFRERLLTWARVNPDAVCRGAKKSRDMLHGRVGFRARAGKLEIADKDALEVWLLAQPPDLGLYRIKAAPNMAEIQALYERTHQVPPGMTYVPEADEPYVKPVSLGTELAQKGK